MTFVRFQSPTLGPRGLHTGVFGLLNGLSQRGLLSPEEESFRRSNNDWYNQHYTNPSDIDALVYDRSANPGAVAWFKQSAQHLINRVDGYLRILEAHGIAWERVQSSNPGRVIYEDDDQVVVVPERH